MNRCTTASNVSRCSNDRPKPRRRIAGQRGSQHAGRGADACHQCRRGRAVVVEPQHQAGDEQFDVTRSGLDRINEIDRGGEQSDRDRGGVGRSS